MKKRIIIGAFAVLAAIGLVFAFSGCDLFATVVSGESQPYGAVINAKTGGAVEAAKVILTPVAKEAPADASEEQTEQIEKENQELEEQQADSPESFYAITNTNGEFDWYTEEKTVPMGTYRLTVEIAGYISIPRTVQVNAIYPNLGEQVVLPYNEATDQYNVSMVLMWNDTFADVDGHLTFPYTDNLADGWEPATYNGYAEDTTSSGFSPTVESGGDGTNGTTYDRERIYWGNATTAAGDSYSTSGISYSTTKDFDADGDGTAETYKISLDVDDRDGVGPETITIRDIPWDWATAETVIDDYTGASSSDFTAANTANYEWVGTMEYYARAYSYANADATTTEVIADSYLSEVADGQAADAVLYVFSGDTIVGIYTIPTYTEVKNASVLRINTFFVSTAAGLDDDYAEFIIYPDIRVINDDNYPASFRGIAPVNEVVSVKIPRR